MSDFSLGDRVRILDTVEKVGNMVPHPVIIFLILIGIAVPATRMVLAQKDASGAELTIKATGYQWKWGYEYVGEGVQFMSHLATPRAQLTGQEGKSAHYLLEVDEPLVVPVGQKVVLSVGARVVTAVQVIGSIGTLIEPSE